MSQVLYQSLSSEPGVYFFLNEKGKILYVGKAINLKKRVSSYFTSKKDLGEKTKALVSQVTKIKTIKVNSEIEALLLEANLIKKHRPKYNISQKDQKSFPLIKINIKEKYPSVTIVRREDDKKSIYFGPFTNSNAVRTVIKTIRRIFPFQSVQNHPQKPCFYYHLGLCPCPNVFKNPEYKKNIKRVIKFLNGDSKKLIKELEKERNILSKEEKYEDAQTLQTKIESIELITNKFHKPWEYELNPNLKSDIKQNEIENLLFELKKSGIKIKNLERIECYDISNISGKLATGSMVVFINGERQTSLYRRFKIRRSYNDKPNDFAMMGEVLQRRFNHKEWRFPSLLIIDGGKGQVSSAAKVLSENNLHIPLIGLAKREETIITPEFKEIKLSKNSSALHLIMRLRDEAHRFAIIYHRKLRRKFIFET